MTWDRRRPDGEADAWFYDLGMMADRIEASERRGRRQRLRIYVVAAFTLLAFLVVAYRSEVNSRRISHNSDRISQAQYAGCVGGLRIILEYNAAQQDFIAIEQSLPNGDPRNQAARIAAYTRAQVLPLPVCAPPR